MRKEKGLPRPAVQDWFSRLCFFVSVWIGQIALAGYLLLDSLLVSHAQPLLLGAVALGNSAYVSAIATCAATLSGSTVILAQESKNSERCFRSFASNVLTLALFLGTIILMFLQAIKHFNIWHSADDTIQIAASQYIRWLSIGVYPTMLYRSTAAICHGAALSKYVCYLQFVGLTIKCISMCFMYFCFPRFAILKICGMSTALSYVFIGTLSVVLLYKTPFVNRFRPRLGKYLLDLRSYIPLIRAGFPIGTASLAELCAFALFSAKIGQFGAVNLAAHQIAYSVISVGYSFTSALSIVTSVRVGQLSRDGAAHAREHEVRRALRWSFVLGITLMLCTATFRSQIASSYTASSDINTLAQQIMLLVAIILFFDSIQATAASSLRAIGCNFLPACVQIAGLWFIGIALSDYLVRFSSPIMNGREAIVYWVAVSIGMSMIAAVLSVLALRRHSAVGTERS
ncbi:MATE family efflux transporter [Caballeronia sp. GaOx3]|uniref:MATE family efflux transporter n=1 Tax=Caballeronia sp. GaOx3 TaxID=2921740 RepID=UPI002028793D|nr:MATE family efflux transporter [Caballeronia sp. GaOx3]